MKCNYCGVEIVGNGAFCRNCGTRLEPVEAPVQQPEVASAEPVMAAEARPFVAADPINLPLAADLPLPKPAPVLADSQLPWENIPQTTPEQEFPVIQVPQPPVIQLPDRRGLAKMIFLGLLTLGIYPVVIWCRIVTELNVAASRYDGKRTMPYFAMVMLAPFTLSILPIVWMHKFCNRIGAELRRRELNYGFGASTFWLWNVLGSFILVGPFIFVHKLMKAMNKINADFNLRG